MPKGCRDPLVLYERRRILSTLDVLGYRDIARLKASPRPTFDGCVANNEAIKSSGGCTLCAYLSIGDAALQYQFCLAALWHAQSPPSKRIDPGGLCRGDSVQMRMHERKAT